MHLLSVLLFFCSIFLAAQAQYGYYPYQYSSYPSYSYPSYYSRSPYGYSQYPSQYPGYYSNNYYSSYNQPNIFHNTYSRLSSSGLLPSFGGMGMDQYGNTYIGSPKNGIFITCNGRGCPGRGK